MLALRVWHQVVSSDDYWSLSLALENKELSSPPVLLSEIDALRDGAVGLAAEPLLVAVAMPLLAMTRLPSAGFWPRWKNCRHRAVGGNRPAGYCLSRR